MRSKKILRGIVISLVFIIVAASVGCTKTSAGDPQETVKGFFEALKSTDISKASSYLSGGEKSLEYDDKQQEEIIKLVLGNLGYSVKGSKTDGDNATVTVDISAPDMVKLTNTVMEEILPKLMEMAASSEAGSEDKAAELTLKSFKDKLSDSKVEKVLSSIDLKLEKTGDKKSWKIISDDNLANAITGNASKAFGEVNGDQSSSGEKDNSEAARENTMEYSEDALVGVWERYGAGDPNAGMKIKVEKKDGGYVGVIVALPEGHKRFNTGEVKWKEIKKEYDNTFSCMDFGKTEQSQDGEWNTEWTPGKMVLMPDGKKIEIQIDGSIINLKKQ